MSIDKILDKIKKLRSLSTSSNQEEAAAAAAKAADLMMEYQIEEAMLEGTPEADEPVEAYLLVVAGKSRVPWKGYIANALAKSLGAKMYWSGGNIVIIGRKSDQQALTYLLSLIERDVNRLADEAWHTRGDMSIHNTPKKWKGSFRIGAAVTIADRIREAYRIKMNTVYQDVSKANALVVINKRLDRVKQIEQNIGLRSTAKTSIANSDGYTAGRAAGHNVNIGQRGLAALPGSRERIS